MPNPRLDKTRRCALSGQVVALQLALVACAAETSVGASDPELDTVTQSYRHRQNYFSWGEESVSNTYSHGCAAIKRGDNTAEGEIAITFYHENVGGECDYGGDWLSNAESVTGIGDGGDWNLVMGPRALRQGEPMVRIKQGTNGGIGFYLANGPGRWVSSNYFGNSTYYGNSDHLELSVKHLLVDYDKNDPASFGNMMKPFTGDTNTMRLSYKNEVVTKKHSAYDPDTRNGSVNNMTLDYRVTLRSCPPEAERCICDATVEENGDPHGECQLLLGLFSYHVHSGEQHLEAGDVKIYSYGGKPKVSYLAAPEGNKMLLINPSKYVGKPVGESFAAPLQQDVYGLKTFGISVSWAQFMWLLKAAATQYSIERYGNEDQITRRDMFGSGWDEPGSWMMVVPRIVVEGRNNGHEFAQHWLGGRFKWAKVEAE